jgi:hypothetical protein
MTSNWALPTTIKQYAESGAEAAHISWLEIDGFSAIKHNDGRSIKTSRDLLHIARDPRQDILEKTYFLEVTGFRFESLPPIITGIEMRLTMNRFGRITDETVQLCLQDHRIGENQASLTTDPTKIFGNYDDLWNSDLTIADVQDPTFGVLLRFQSHPRWPHRCGAMIDSIELRVH